MTVFDTAIDTIYGDDNLAVNATYTPLGGSGAAVRVIIDHDVDLVLMAQSDVADRRAVISVRKSEAASPGKGDTFLIGAVTYTVDVLIEDDSIEARLAVQ